MYVVCLNNVNLLRFGYDFENLYLPFHILKLRLKECVYNNHKNFIFQYIFFFVNVIVCNEHI